MRTRDLWAGKGSLDWNCKKRVNGGETSKGRRKKEQEGEEEWKGEKKEEGE